jgi:mycofactocin radical SAM maturase
MAYYACNLECAHCLSSSGRRDPRELTTEQCEAVIDELQRMQVFYVNIGGGEPTIRPDFWHLLQYAVDHQVGVKFSTNGVRITPERAAFLASTDYVDVQISLDGATAEVNDYVRGPGSYDMALTALQNLQDAGFRDAKISVVCTRQNIGQLDEFKELADRFGATLRLTRLRPSGRGADVWDELHPLPEQQRELYDWLMAHGEGVLTGDSFFHLAAFLRNPHRVVDIHEQRRLDVEAGTPTKQRARSRRDRRRRTGNPAAVAVEVGVAAVGPTGIVVATGSGVIEKLGSTKYFARVHDPEGVEHGLDPPLER